MFWKGSPHKRLLIVAAAVDATNCSIYLYKRHQFLHRKSQEKGAEANTTPE